MKTSGNVRAMVALRAGLARFAVSTVLGAVAFGSGAAFAQDADEADRVTNQDIVVTAQRRSERLLDVPMSVTALSAETLAKSGVVNTTDLAKVTPGLTMNFYGNNLQPSIRGVTATGGNVGDNPSVAFYLDGVYQAQQIATLFDLPDVEQIEVLKGPQGTRYGQNATGGAIIITTKSPSLEQANGKFSASYGNYNDVQLRGFVSVPLVNDVVAVSLAGAFHDRQGLRRNLVFGNRDRGINSKVLRGKLLVQPADRLKFTVTGYYSDHSDSAPFAAVTLNDNSLGYALNPNAPRVTRPSKQFSGIADPFVNPESWGVSLHAEWELDAGTINWTSAYAHSEVRAYEDLDASPVNIAEYFYDSLNDTTKVHELNFVSRDFGGVSFLVGALYLDAHSQFKYGQYIQYPDFVNPATITTLPTLPPPPVANFRSRGDVWKDIWAAYAEVTVNVTDALVLTAGGRYTQEKQDAQSDNGFLPAPVPYAFGKEKWNKFTPRITARYELSPDSNVYATYAKGFKGGLINTADVTNQEAVDPEVITSYEVGFKGKPMPNMTVTAAGFWYDYKNLQVVAYKGGSTGSYITQNAASTRGKGGELDINWAATPEFSLRGGVAYVDAKYRNFPDAATFVPTGFGGNMNVSADLSGRRLLRAPKWTVTLSGNYEKETDAGTFGAFASFYYNSGQFLETSSRIYQSGYALIDGELSYAPATVPGLRVVLWGKNLTDKDYLAGALVTDFSDQVAYAEPRTFGVRAEFAF